METSIPNLHNIPVEDFENLVDALMERLIHIEMGRYSDTIPLLREYVTDVETVIVENATYRPGMDPLSRNRILQGRLAELLFLRRRALDEMFCDLSDPDEMSALEKLNSALCKVGGALDASDGIMETVGSFVGACDRGAACTQASKIQCIPFSRDTLKFKDDNEYGSRFDVLIPLITALDRKNFSDIHADRVAADCLLDSLEGMDLCDCLRELHYLLLSLPDIVRLSTFKVSSELIINR